MTRSQSDFNLLYGPLENTEYGENECERYENMKNFSNLENALDALGRRPDGTLIETSPAEVAESGVYAVAGRKEWRGTHFQHYDYRLLTGDKDEVDEMVDVLSGECQSILVGEEVPLERML